ncbi:MAG: hypothetical protein ACRD2X_11705 [Vicinamibacteraceae bacterium]
MARGWESKSVEAQQQDAARGRSSVAPEDPHRRTLELARTRAMADLAVATVPAHRAMLEKLIAALDEQIAAL